MPLELETVDPRGYPTLARFIDSVFERAGRESRLVAALADGDPRFDPGLCLVAKGEHQKPVGFALFLPRNMRLRGQMVRLALSSPFGVLPAARGQGVGRFLARTGLGALRDRGLRGAIAIGARPFFESHGYAPAFNFYSLRVRRDDLAEGVTAGWRGLSGADLPALVSIYERCYGETPGSEERHATASDWACATEGAHTLVLERDGAPAAYLRFRTRASLEVRECGALDAAAVQSVLAFLRRLANEHGTPVLDVHLPPRHPVARALFQRGALQSASDFGGAAMLAVVDWPGLLSDLAPSFAQPLAQTGGAPLSIEFGETSFCFTPRADGSVEIGTGRVKGAHLAPPVELGPPLITGQRGYLDLRWDAGTLVRSDLCPEGWERVRALFPTATPSWTYAPVFELADD